MLLFRNAVSNLLHLLVFAESGFQLGGAGVALLEGFFSVIAILMYFPQYVRIIIGTNCSWFFSGLARTGGSK